MKKIAPKKNKATVASKKNAKPAKAKKGWSSFAEWWEKVAQKKAEKIERDWLKENEPNSPDEDEGGDHWCVNEMMHSGDALEIAYDKAEEVWNVTMSGDKWEMSQGDSLYCDLDSVIMEAHEAAKESRK